MNEEVPTSDEHIKEYTKEIKKISYEVEDVEDSSGMGILDTIAVRGIQSEDIQDAKTLEVGLKVETEDGEQAVTVEFDVIKVHGRWYALSDLLY